MNRRQLATNFRSHEVSEVPNKPMVPTAPTSPVATPLHTMRRHIGQPFGRREHERLETNREERKRMFWRSLRKACHGDKRAERLQEAANSRE